MNAVTIFAALASVAAAFASAYGVRSQRKLTAAQAALTGSQVKQSDLDLLEQTLGLHEKTVSERLAFLREQLDNAVASREELQVTVALLKASVDKMTETLEEFLDKVNGSLSAEWRTRLEQLLE